MISGLSWLFVTIVIFWLILLTLLILKTFSNLNSIFRGSKNQNITDIIHSIIKSQESNSKNIVKLENKLNDLEEITKFSIQRVGLVRFNPFSDTGGEQSFILALVDKKNSGVIISGLYARSGMRWYIKKVKNGSGIDHELSKEELKAIESAK